MLALIVASVVLAGSCAGALAAAWAVLAVLFHAISPRVPDVPAPAPVPSPSGWPSHPATVE
jgi:hypothetical protein